MHPKAKEIYEKVIQLQKDNPDIHPDAQYVVLVNLVLDEKLSDTEAKDLIKEIAEMVLEYNEKLLRKLQNDGDINMN